MSLKNILRENGLVGIHTMLCIRKSINTTQHYVCVYCVQYIKVKNLVKNRYRKEKPDITL